MWKYDDGDYQDIQQYHANGKRVMQIDTNTILASLIIFALFNSFSMYSKIFFVFIFDRNIEKMQLYSLAIQNTE